ncbi:hypothetical protein ACJMK2_025654 [Sinanodonta woodiana]|uniref:Uncharacterized protein n=1 Tax=Sinanodonta woodiana TaxID=1069815 RepID=A0ABD3XH83_SINWO
MTPLPLHLVCVCLAIIYVTEGRIVRGVIGQNVSFSMTFDTIDLMHIKHNNSAFVMVWPDNNNRTRIQQPKRVGIVICYTKRSKAVNVTINIMNLMRNDTGIYSAVRAVTPTEIHDSVNLEIIENTFLYIRNLTIDYKFNLYTCQVSGSELQRDPYRIDIYHTKATTLLEETKETNHYTTQTLRKKEDTQGTCHDVRGSLKNTVPTSDGNENVNQAECYWTIVSNANDEMSTTIETVRGLSPESPLVVPILVHTNSRSDEWMGADDIHDNQEFHRYSNPIRSCTMEFNDYIHPIHSIPLNTYMLSEFNASKVFNKNMSICRDVKAISI